MKKAKTKKPRKKEAPEPNIEIIQACAELCRRDFYFFLKQFIHITIRDRMVWNWHIKYLCDTLQMWGERIIERDPFIKDYLIINVPPGSTKSTIASQFFPVWLWINDPTLTSITLSHTDALAVRHAMRSRDIIQNSKFKEFFPDIRLRKDLANKKTYGLAEGGTRIVTSVGGSITGDHADCIIIDDPLKVDEAVSEAERSNANDFIKQTLPTRKKNSETCPTIMIMQRLHEVDPTGMLIDEMPEMVEHICLPAELSIHVKPKKLKERYSEGLLDQTRLNRKVLDGKLKVLGSYGYAGQYKQLPAPEEGGLLKKEWFKIIDFDHVPKGNINFWVDPAYTKDEENDPSAIMATIENNGRLYILNAATVYMEFPDLIKFIVKWIKENGYNETSMLRVEPKASGKDIVSTLRSLTKLNVRESKNPTKDKVSRVKDISASVESGHVYMVRGGWNTAFIDECATFPNARNDDQVDLLSMAGYQTFRKKKLVYIA